MIKNLLIVKLTQTGFRARDLETGRMLPTVIQLRLHIAEQGFPEDFDGVFLWVCIENRPYLRALHGLCLAQWKSESFEDALGTAKKLLRLCPTDNLGVRLIIDDIARGVPWGR